MIVGVEIVVNQNCCNPDLQSWDHRGPDHHGPDGLSPDLQGLNHHSPGNGSPDLQSQDDRSPDSLSPDLQSQDRCYLLLSFTPSRQSCTSEREEAVLDLVFDDSTVV